MSRIRIATDDPAFELVNHAFAAFMRALRFGSGMTVDGVFVNGHVCSREELATACCDGNGEVLDHLVSTGYLDYADGVYFVVGREKYYGAKQYNDSTLSRLVSSMRDAVDPDQLHAITARIVGNDEIKKDLTDHELKQEILFLYSSFGEHRGVATAYMGSFRTKQQKETGERIALPRHFRILKELYDLYDSGVVTHGKRTETVGRDVVVRAMIDVGNRGKLEFKNHNYLKLVCFSFFEQPAPREVGNGAKRNAEGY